MDAPLELVAVLALGLLLGAQAGLDKLLGHSVALTQLHKPHQNPDPELEPLMNHLHLHGLLLLPCIPLLLCAAAPVIAGGGRREAQALLRWKASLAGVDDYESLSSWNLAANSTATTTTSPCGWAFVACNTAGDVTELSLSNVVLNGTLAGLDFSALPRLETLVLEQNYYLHGTIPEGIGNSTSLALLRITSNKHLTGSIPRSIGKLKQLAALDLGSLGLVGAIPVEIANLTRLEDLRLDGNSLTGSIPPEIGRLEKVRSLYLGGNKLTGSIPPEIGNITELQIMDLADNHLEEELPLTLSQLVKLTALFVSSNQLEGHIATQLGNKSSLNHVEISRNRFSRLFPQSICTRGGALQNFAANGNGFQSLHDLNFQNCTSLASLDLAANNILGDITEWIGTLPKQLLRIYLTQNQLYGALPRELSEFVQLTVLELGENEISGEIPPTLGNITGPGTLNLGHNLLAGTVPAGLGALLEIYSLDLSYNYLSGPMPLTLSNLSNLALLDLSNCSLTGDAYGLLVADQSDSSPNLSFPDIEILALAS
ncbi:probable leucine-rich repeat receptor-like protein kinase At1g35710 [Panicum hallii]|jgi:Leucine-rich repeat (LRR) protein|uniref:probable leucine-rich repeat receptor-like protein kinase At1g35710 n=1 Tax=Panicum hallii TaxID=206008 RepID=UPI000DF4D7EF|nr:probable leucine-rich repeat receptor-like protein kinase At1g35710 [Panicum hallii]